MSFLKKLNFNLNCDRPESFVGCQWQRDKCQPNVKYLIYRWIIAAYFAFVVILSFITATECNDLAIYAIYLTNWNVILNGCSSLFAAVLVTLFYRKKYTFGRDPHNDNGRSVMSASFKAFWLLSTLSIVLSISVCLIYWPLIHVGRDDGLNDTLTHGINAVVNFIDLFIIAHPPRYGHVLHVFLAGLIYIFFSIIYTLAGGRDRDNNNYIYSVIDWKNHTVNAIVFAISTIVFLSIMHFILTAFESLRIYVHRRLCSGDNDGEGEGRRTNINQNSVDNLGFSA